MGKFRGLAQNSAAHKKLWAPVIINLDHMTPFNCIKEHGAPTGSHTGFKINHTAVRQLCTESK